jgi:hypothetical protein
VSRYEFGFSCGASFIEAPVFQFKPPEGVGQTRRHEKQSSSFAFYLTRTLNFLICGVASLALAEALTT